MARADHSVEKFLIAACECGVGVRITEEPVGCGEEAFGKERFGADCAVDRPDLRSGSGGFPDQLPFDGFQRVAAALRKDFAFAPEQIRHLLFLKLRLMARQTERETPRTAAAGPAQRKRRRIVCSSFHFMRSYYTLLFRFFNHFCLNN